MATNFYVTFLKQLQFDKTKLIFKILSLLRYIELFYLKKLMLFAIMKFLSKKSNTLLYALLKLLSKVILPTSAHSSYVY